MSGSLPMLVPCILVAVISSGVSQSLGLSIYELNMVSKGIESLQLLLQGREANQGYMKASDVMTIIQAPAKVIVTTEGNQGIHGTPPSPKKSLVRGISGRLINESSEEYKQTDISSSTNDIPISMDRFHPSNFNNSNKNFRNSFISPITHDDDDFYGGCVVPLHCSPLRLLRLLDLYDDRQFPVVDELGRFRLVGILLRSDVFECLQMLFGEYLNIKD